VFFVGKGSPLMLCSAAIREGGFIIQIQVSVCKMVPGFTILILQKGLEILLHGEAK